MTSPDKPQSGWMRAELPNVAVIVDLFRSVFGDETITDGLRESRRDGSFYAEDFITGHKIEAKVEEVVVANGISGDGVYWARVRQVSK
jgi:hypothetical protein